MEKPDLSLFPITPGVYLYKDAAGHILYVGKARRLRNRIASYFREDHALTPKTRAMLRHAVTIDTLQTGTEKESLLLESSLIKKHRPRYNIVLRDDKEYLLFRIGSEHPYPRVEIVRHNQNKKRDRGAKIFGPFSSGSAARETWRLIHKNFPLRRCRDRAFANRTRPCLYYDMGQCLGPCVLPVPREEYQAILHKVSLLLAGRSRHLVQTLQDEMGVAAEALAFEKAAALRDQIRAVEKTVERQSVVLAAGVNLDLAGVAQVPEGLALGIVFVRDGLLLDGRNFFWPGLSVEDTPELIAGFLTQYYLGHQGVDAAIPPRIVVPWLPDATTDCDEESAVQVHQNHPEEGAGFENKAIAACFGTATQPETSTLQALEALLSERRGSSVVITRPRNPDEDNLLLMAASNAREAVKVTATTPLADLLAARLHSTVPIRRIEAVDISHTSGQQTRAGMVVFEDEEPVTSDYRNYALDEGLAAIGAEAGDDYSALALWAKRRATAGAPWPQLVLVDGGKGQLAAVYRAFSEAGVIQEFMLAAITKARDDEGRADRRAGNVSDRIFLPGRSNPVNLQSGSPELLYLQRVRDTVHDFVIGRHRQARAAATLTGELTRLPGVGPKTARLLFDHFGSLAAMVEAGSEALEKVPGIGKAKAEAIFQRLSMLLGTKE